MSKTICTFCSKRFLLWTTCESIYPALAVRVPGGANIYALCEAKTSRFENSQQSSLFELMGKDP